MAPVVYRKPSKDDYKRNIGMGLIVAFFATFLSLIPAMIIADEVFDDYCGTIMYLILAAVTCISFLFTVFLATHIQAKSAYKAALKAEAKTKHDAVISRVWSLIQRNSEVIAKASYWRQNNGNIHEDEWVYSFIEEYIDKYLDESSKLLVSYSEVCLLVKRAVPFAREQFYDVLGYKDNLTGVEFENFCRMRLERNGWHVTSTKASGDQGVDLIAKKDMITVAIQCKKYTGTVGNKAVQEVYSGAKHYCIKIPIVVTNSTYTKSATELAKTTGVMLLQFCQLEHLYDYLRPKVK
jgi:restriction endonuclease Mrr